MAKKVFKAGTMINPYVAIRNISGDYVCLEGYPKDSDFDGCVHTYITPKDVKTLVEIRNQFGPETKFRIYGTFVLDIQNPDLKEVDFQGLVLNCRDSIHLDGFNCHYFKKKCGDYYCRRIYLDDEINYINHKVTVKNLTLIADSAEEDASFTADNTFFENVDFVCTQFDIDTRDKSKHGWNHVFEDLTLIGDEQYHPGEEFCYFLYITEEVAKGEKYYNI